MTTINRGGVAWPVESDAVEKLVWDSQLENCSYQLYI